MLNSLPKSIRNIPGFFVPGLVRQEFQDPSSATASSAGGREATRGNWSYGGSYE